MGKFIHFHTVSCNSHSQENFEVLTLLQSLLNLLVSLYTFDIKHRFTLFIYLARERENLYRVGGIDSSVQTMYILLKTTGVLK